MDLNQKVEQLLQITTALKNEVNEIKSGDLHSKLDELEWEKEALKDDIIDLRHSLMQQNERILSLLREQNEKLVETIETEKLAPHLVFSKKISEHAKLFPVKSLKELDELEANINDNNLNELVAAVQLLTPHGIVKNIVAVLSVECIVECNVDGLHYKRRLLNYTKFLDMLFQAAYYDGYTQKTFLDEVRRGLKLVKNRHNKNLFRSRQLQRLEEQNADFEEDAQIETVNAMETTEDFIKKEEILCD